MSITKATDRPGTTTASSAGDTSADTSTGTSTGGDAEARHSQTAVDRANERARLAAEGGPDPFPPYDLMDLDELREVAAELGVTLPPDAEKGLWITELRAHRTGALTPARRRAQG